MAGRIPSGARALAAPAATLVLMDKPIVVLAGATGNLGGRIARALVARRAEVRAIVRHGASLIATEPLRRQGVQVIEVDFASPSALTLPCTGATVVVSALSGLGDVLVEVQSTLLAAAVQAGVPRFIPSDYAIDFTRVPRGMNRNLDLRQEFRDRLERAPIAATSVLCGMFTDLLVGPAPLVLFPLRRVVYWENPDQLLDFTTVDDTAEYTASAALDATTPRFLRIAGEQLAARGLADAASEATGASFHLLRAGSLSRLETLIRITRAVVPARDQVFPPWQGMQYLRDMFSGAGKLAPLDTDRYPDIRWTPVRDVLASR